MPAFDPKHHYIDEHGFQRHAETHHLVGIEQAPPAKHPDHGSEFPKWVKLNLRQIHRDANGHVSTPGYEKHFVRRDGVVEVLVHDAAEEARAIADPLAAEETHAPA